MLKITSLVVVILAGVTMVFLGIYTFRRDTRTDELLSGPDAVERFRARAQDAVSTQPKESPLVSQAKQYHLRLDPPPPPEPVERKTTDSGGARTPSLDINVRPKVVQAVKFNLVATCVYEEHPEKSLALLNLPGEGNKWFRQGEEVGHAVIEEIRDGSVIYVANEARQEVFMPKPPSQLPSPLLAGNAEAHMKETTKMIEQMLGGNVRDLGPAEGKTSTQSGEPQASASESPDGLPTKTQRSRYANYRREETSETDLTADNSPPPIDPEENVKMLGESISQVEELIANSKKASTPEEQQGAAMLTAMLKMLEESKKEAEDYIKKEDQQKQEDRSEQENEQVQEDQRDQEEQEGAQEDE